MLIGMASLIAAFFSFRFSPADSLRRDDRYVPVRIRSYVSRSDHVGSGLGLVGKYLVGLVFEDGTIQVPELLGELI